MNNTNNTNAFSHLTLVERRIILTGIINGSTKTAIAQTIGKDKSTVGKEIKLHRSLTHKCKIPLECSNYRKCPFDRQCTSDCPKYSPFHCSNWSHCRFDKYQYCPKDAQMDYRTTLVAFRQGVNHLCGRIRKPIHNILNSISFIPGEGHFFFSAGAGLTASKDCFGWVRFLPPVYAS